MKETRLDIDPSWGPDIVASMTDMGDIGQYDAIYCSHALEHLSMEDAIKALSEFRRVLNPGGRAFVIVPDTEGVSPTDEPLLETPAGIISGNDILFGASWLTKDNPFMVHKTQFTKESIESAMKSAGFQFSGASRGNCYNLIAIGANDV